MKSFSGDLLFMGKKEALAFLGKLQAKGIRLGLGRLEVFLPLINSPEEKFKSVHVTGTNGKGSTAAMIASILQQAGYKTGLYTSPHLLKLNERIQVNGKQITDKRLFGIVNELKKEYEDCREELTFFEYITAVAFRYFAEQKVDFAVVEAGMGGRLDATNVIMPLVSVITNVEREHQQHLGKTAQAIAKEKAGIIKEHIPVVTAEWKKTILKIFKKKCKENKSKLVVVKKPFKGRLGLLGSFQRWNAATAVAVAKELQKQGVLISEKAIREGLANAKWPGRFQIAKKNPTVIFDCAHNPACAFVLSKAFKEQFPGKRALLVIGISEDKNAAGMAKLLKPIAERVFVTAAKHRAMEPKKLANQFQRLSTETEIVQGVGNAVRNAIKSAAKSDVVLVTGSCFVVGEAMKLLKQGVEYF